MKFTEVVNKRYSMRQYQPTDVPESLIRKIVDLAKLAPSAGNLQSYKVYITKEKITNIKAPVNFVICADLDRSGGKYGERGRNLYAIQDATIFGAYLQLAIVDAGLASAWVGAFREGRIKTLLKIPDNHRPVTVITMGYPIGEKSGRRRRSFEEIVSWQK
ncbi:MAG: nitroreductase family protein [Candidatus Woesebacteria bacterium]|jgi:nitroreductase|nr:nitroreductase family protein [Candidatus Woesebacteria bacterium]